jgi:hypothetical protein
MSRQQIPLSNFQKEIQATIAFVILDYLYQQNQTMQKKQLFNSLFDCFHGKGTTASQKKMFMAGQAPYSKLFSQDGSGNVSGAPSDLVVHSFLARLDDRLIKVGSIVTEDIIGSSTLKTGKVINGETLVVAANEALKNCKKALAIANEFLDSNKNIPSGKTIEDYLDFVPQRMYEEHFHKQKTKGGNPIMDSNNENNEDDDSLNKVEEDSCKNSPADSTAVVVPQG